MKNRNKVEKLKKDAENLAESSRDVFVDYVNEITDKAQAYTADKLEKLEKKTTEILEDSKASIKSKTRTLNNMVSKNSDEFKSAVDTILFE